MIGSGWRVRGVVVALYLVRERDEVVEGEIV